MELTIGLGIAFKRATIVERATIIELNDEYLGVQDIDGNRFAIDYGAIVGAKGTTMLTWFERSEELLANPLRRYWLPGTTDGYLTPSEVLALPAGSNFAFDGGWPGEAPIAQGTVSGPDGWGRYTLTKSW